VLGAAAAVALAVGCKASVSAHAKTNVEAKRDAVDIEEPADDTGHESALAPGQTEERASGTPALLGARHDVVLVPGKQSVDCSCLAVALGVPTSAAFGWDSVVPSIDGASQQVIAFSSKGTACPDEPEDSLGASYWGYQVRGKDVVVLVEPARHGRPMTTGAIIPAPVAGGRTLVAPVDASVPYGKAPGDGGVRCVVGQSEGAD
jgi:hypothetical protein